MEPSAPPNWRIAHTESSLGWGGQEHRILAELTGFQRRGSRVWLAAPPDAQVFARARAAGVPVIPLSAGKLGFPFSVLRFARWLRHERIQVLNPHSSRDSWIAGLAGRLARVPFIVRTRHFDVPIQARWLSRHAYVTLCDHLLTTSPKVSAHLRQFFQLPENRVSTVSTGVDVHRFCPEGARASVAPEVVAKGIPLVGMVAVIRKAKGCDVLVEAARLLRERNFPVHCVFVGEGPYRPYLEQFIAEREMQAHTTFLGHREDVPELLRSFQILALPSLHEAVPQAGLQALACATPVVASDVGGIPEIIRAGQTGRLVPPGDATALAAALQEALADTAQTRALAERGRAFVGAEHSLERMLDRLEEIYRRHFAGRAGE